MGASDPYDAQVLEPYKGSRSQTSRDVSSDPANHIAVSILERRFQNVLSKRAYVMLHEGEASLHREQELADPLGVLPRPHRSQASDSRHCKLGAYGSTRGEERQRGGAQGEALKNTKVYAAGHFGRSGRLLKR
ncbi:hypothetical protein MTO96_003176 [Rhipicephalus appendiculatus]